MQVTLGYILKRSGIKFLKKTAIFFEDKRITYEELNHRVNQVANALLKMGVKKGDKVASLLFNTPELIEIYFAAAKIGAVNIPVNFRLIGREVSYIVQQSDSIVLFYDADLRKIIDDLSTKDSLKLISVGSTRFVDSEDYYELRSASVDKDPDVQVKEEDLRFIMYTSGTTGVPKGAMFSHKSNLWAALILSLTKKYDSNEVILLVNPLFHMNSYINLIAAVYWGNKIVLMKNFDSIKMLQLIEQEKVSICSIVPTMCKRLIEKAKTNCFDLKSWRYCTCTGAAWSVELKKNFRETFPGVIAADAYGATEIMAGTLLEGEDLVRKANSVGKPYLDTIIKIIDEKGQELSANQIGEIVLYGPHIMEGYYKMPEASEEALIEGWFHSGDVGYFDEEGYLYFLDRRKDMIVSGGENIYTAEIEKVLMGHEKISNSAVVGEPDAEWGQVVKAFIVLEENETMTPEEVIQYCKENLASYKKPRHVEFVESLPKNALGKILKRNIR